MWSVSNWCILHTFRTRVIFHHLTPTSMFQLSDWFKIGMKSPNGKKSITAAVNQLIFIVLKEVLFWKLTKVNNFSKSSTNQIMNIFLGWNRAPNQCFRGEFENWLKLKLKIIKKTSKSCLAACLLDKYCSGYHHSGLEDCFLLMFT